MHLEGWKVYRRYQTPVADREGSRGRWLLTAIGVVSQAL